MLAIVLPDVHVATRVLVEGELASFASPSTDCWHGMSVVPPLAPADDTVGSLWLPSTRALTPGKRWKSCMELHLLGENRGIG